ncbi:MAG TPA: LuxR C-terminal-related transcriptional regulator [Methylomirabilota bacterium]|nr:LuxR C-terminal-related transcriptional regulator [Methylomirabilota bacterium]
MVDQLDLLANTADGVVAVDAQGRIVLWNDAAEKILGYSRREVLGKACCEILKGLDGSGNRLCHAGCHVLTMVKRGERVQHYDMEVATKNRRSAWLNVSIIVLPGNRGGLEVTAHLFRDVTYLHRLQELIREKEDLSPAPVSNNGAAPELTKREREILQLVAGGLRTDAISDKLCISSATVRNHVQNILAKLDAHSRLEAVALATKHHLV